MKKFIEWIRNLFKKTPPAPSAPKLRAPIFGYVIYHDTGLVELLPHSSPELTNARCIEGYNLVIDVKDRWPEDEKAMVLAKFMSRVGTDHLIATFDGGAFSFQATDRTSGNPVPLPKSIAIEFLTIHR